MTSLLQTSRNTIKHDSNCGSFISRLLSACCPAAIRLAIWKIIVDAIKRVTLSRTRPNISKESLERQPFVAYRNSSSTIAREPYILRIIASLKHMGPAGVFKRSSSTCSVPMSGVGSISTFQPETSTTAYRILFAPYLTRRDNSFFSTIASAQPESSDGCFFRNTQDDQSRKSLSCSINKCHNSNVSAWRTNVKYINSF